MHTRGRAMQQEKAGMPAEGRFGRRDRYARELPRGQVRERMSGSGQRRSDKAER